ncbi:MAG: hypothetical protein GX366_07995 [Epulopiscium sp.]|nr:hypothetical protein [Candidatus Epulonipiscium sp.]
MLTTDAESINLTQIETLIDITKQFLDLTDELLRKGDISKEEYEKLTHTKKQFLQDVNSEYK